MLAMALGNNTDMTVVNSVFLLAPVSGCGERVRLQLYHCWHGAEGMYASCAYTSGTRYV